MTFWRNCRVNASHFGKRSLGAFLQWVTQNRIFKIFLCFAIWYLILYFNYNKMGFVWIQITHLLFTFIPKTLTMSYLTMTICFHISATLGSNAPSEKGQESAKCVTVHVERFAITFCWSVCNNKDGLWIGNIHMVLQIFIHYVISIFMIMKCYEKNRWIWKIV